VPTPPTADRSGAGFLLPVAQLPAEDLAAGRLRHRLDEIDPLVRRGVLGDVAEDLSTGGYSLV
jgi:hypothetical protein